MEEQFYWWSLGNLTFLGSGYRAWEFLFNSLEIWHKCRSLIMYKEDYSWTHGVMVLVLTHHSVDPLGGTTGCLLIDGSFHVQCWLLSTFFFCHPFEGHWSYGLYCQIGKKKSFGLNMRCTPCAPVVDPSHLCNQLVYCTGYIYHWAFIMLISPSNWGKGQEPSEPQPSRNMAFH